jgi:glucosamine 6-phosphate synthetase-like amidotransferase/phosphosugar isomerase protein
VCGIFGYASAQGIPKWGRVTELALLTEVLGEDAWGLAYLDGKEVKSFKNPGAIRLAVNSKEWRRIRKKQPRVLIGHARDATHGDPGDNANNHPFDYPHVVLIHNGVVSTSGRELPLKGSCDSEIIAYLMNEALEAGQDPMESGLQELRGSYACAALLRDGSLLLFKNHMPIHISIEGKRVLWFSSSNFFLKHLGYESFPVPSNSWLRIRTDDGRLKVEVGRIPVPKFDPTEKQWQPARSFLFSLEHLKQLKDGTCPSCGSPTYRVVYGGKTFNECTGYSFDCDYSELMDELYYEAAISEGREVQALDSELKSPSQS